MINKVASVTALMNNGKLLHYNNIDSNILMPKCGEFLTLRNVVTGVTTLLNTRNLMAIEIDERSEGECLTKNN